MSKKIFKEFGERLLKYKNADKFKRSLKKYKGIDLLTYTYKNYELCLYINEYSDSSDKLDIMLFKNGVPSNSVNFLKTFYDGRAATRNIYYDTLIILGIMDFIRSKKETRVLENPTRVFGMLTPELYEHVADNKSKNTLAVKYIESKKIFQLTFIENKDVFVHKTMKYVSDFISFTATPDSMKTYIEKNIKY